MNKLRIFPPVLLLLLLFVSTSCKREIRDLDGNLYSTVKIGNQVWMKENLNVSHFSNGDPIAEAKSAGEWIMLGMQKKPAWCAQGNNPDNERTYGKLYNWYAVNDPRGLAPEGFHVPTDDEWTQLINYFGGSVMAALKMRANTGAGTNQAEKGTGFDALSAGYRTVPGKFEGVGSYAYWWSTTEITKDAAWVRFLDYLYCNIYFSANNKASGFSVRCIRN